MINPCTNKSRIDATSNSMRVNVHNRRLKRLCERIMFCIIMKSSYKRNTWRRSTLPQRETSCLQKGQRSGFWLFERNSSRFAPGTFMKYVHLTARLPLRVGSNGHEERGEDWEGWGLEDCSRVTREFSCLRAVGYGSRIIVLRLYSGE